jgi:LacI family transcriptional regulator
MQRTVALLIECSRTYGREVLRGIAEYCRGHVGWNILYEERAMGDDPPEWFTAGKYDGIIARVDHQPMADLILKMGRPAIDVRGRRPLPGVPVVGTDERLSVELAIHHLRDRGFEKLAFCGFGGADYSEKRAALFQEISSRIGFPCHVHQSPAPPEALDTAGLEAHAMRSDPHLVPWLAGLPKPIGLMACNDVCGRQVLDVCRLIGIHVPEEIAVLGHDDDHVFCELSDPLLSSVIPACQRIGYEAAALLERMMDGESVPTVEWDIAPLGIAIRRSTDMMAIGDPAVALALAFIRDHATSGITAEQVLDHLARKDATALSRGTLHKRFVSYLGRSVKDEILRVRMRRIKQLLQDSRHPLATIAEMVGLEHPEQLNVIFKRETGETPGEYRKRTQNSPKR